LQEIEGLTGLEDIRKITLVETSESSFSSESGNMSFSQQQQYDTELARENENLMDLQQRVLDMMED
jgi:hypothetical protein